MAFKLATSPDFLALVTTELPGDNGKPIKASFHVKFKRLSTSEFDELAKALNEKDEEGAPKITNQEIVDQVLTGFGDDLQDEDGKPLEFNSDTVADLCNIFPMRNSIVEAFFAGYVRAKAKN